jgi:hypothetical protein
MITDQVVPQEGVPQPAGHASRWQLAVIGAVVALAVGIGLVLGFTVLSPRAAALSTAAGYVPAGAAMYMEAHLDPSENQRAALRAILERFPAVDPDDILTDALADTLDQAESAFGLPVTYSEDIAPWFDGTVAVSLLDYPLTMDASSMALPQTAAMFGVKDSDAAATFGDTLRAALTDTGATFSQAEHAGTTIWSLDVAEMQSSVPVEGVGFAFAVTGDEVLMANGQGVVQAMLDAHDGSSSLATKAELGRLAARLPADWVGLMAVNTQSMFAGMRAQLADQQPELAELVDSYLENVPDLSVATFRFADDALLFDGSSDVPTGPLAPENGQRSLAAAVPGDAILFADGSRVGSGLSQAISTMRAAIALQEGGDEITAQIEQAEAAIGADLEDFVSWIGGGALAAGWDGEQPYGGLVLEAADPDAASTRLGQLKALIELAAQESGQSITVETVDIAGVEVTRIVMAGSGDDFMPTPGFEVQYATNGETVLIGIGDQFVRRSLEMAAGASLADSERFGAALGRFGGTDNAGTFFLDLATLRQTVEEELGLAQDPMYASQIQPNLVPFDYLAMVTRVEGDAAVSRGGLVLR